MSGSGVANRTEVVGLSMPLAQRLAEIRTGAAPLGTPIWATMRIRTLKFVVGWERGRVRSPLSASDAGLSTRACTMFDNGAMIRALLLWSLAILPALPAAEVLLERTGDQIAVSIDGQPFTAFYFGTEATKPYLHPLRTADGTMVTRGYPMEEIAGEQRDHPHHRGVWFSHGAVNGVDFWANEESQRSRGDKGTIEFNEIDAVQSGDEKGLIEASFSWKAPGGDLLLTERRTMAFQREGEDNIVDFDIVLVAETDPVLFGDTKEGTFAVRLATELEEQHMRAKGIPRTGRIVNAEGHETEANAWGKRSAWVDYSGSISGEPMGVAIFDHPGNPKHPSYWHVRGYGLFAANIFGEHDFHADESRDGSITLAKGEELRFRYRVIVHKGGTADTDLQSRFEAWGSSGSR